MIIKCASSMKGLAKVANMLVNENSKAASLLSDATLSIGPANDPAYGVPASAVSNPLFVGDAAMIGASRGNTPELEALYKKSARNIDIRPVYNPTTQKYDLVFSKSAGFTGDGAISSVCRRFRRGMRRSSPNCTGSRCCTAMRVSW